MTAKDLTGGDEYKGKVGFRHLQILLMFIVFLYAMCLRVNMSMAIVSMTDKNNENYFDWSLREQSVVLSSFSWGYVVTQLPAGELAARFGPQRLLTLCLVVNSAVVLVLPACAYYGGWKLVCAGRVIQGLGQGTIMPCMHNLLAKWAPLKEQSRLASFVYSGAHLGIAVQMLVSGYIIDWQGWPAIFYINFVIGASLVIVNMVFGADSPQVSKWISEKERFYIQSSLNQVGGHKKLPTPWKKMFTSMPFIAIAVANWASMWGLWTFMTLIPTYLNQVQGVSITANGVMSAVPYIGIFVMSFPIGYAADLMIRKKWFSITVTRKIFNSIGYYGPGITLIGLTYAPADVTVSVILLTVVVALNAGYYSGFQCGHIDIAPNFAGTMSGLTNGCANVIAILAPLVAGFLVKDENNADDWRKVFYVSSAVYIFCNTFYLIFGSSERQAWNEPESAVTDEDIEEKKTKF